jgi:MSHA biogenesis protein MshP
MRNPSRQRGLSLFAAIFLIVVLAALGAFLVTVSGLQHSSSALDIQGARAYQAARAGIEWGAYRALRNNVCAAPTSFSPGATLSEFTVTVACTATAYSEATPATGTVYRIVATACNRPNAGTCPGNVGQNYVERQLQATMDKVNP